MKETTEFPTARSAQHSRTVHFSWLFFAFTLLLALCSVVAFSSKSLHALNDTYQIPFDFPGHPDQWNLSGDKEAFKSCATSLCVSTVSGNRSRLSLDIPVAPDIFDDVDQLVYEVQFIDWQDAKPFAHEALPSYIVARARSASGQGLRNIGSIIALEPESKKKLHKRVSSLHAQTASLQLVFLARSTTAAQIEDVRFFTVTLSDTYQVLRALIFMAWVALLLFLILRILSHFSARSRLISAFGFILVLVIGAGENTAVLTNFFARYFPAILPAALSDLLLLPTNTQLATVHAAFHFVLTLCLGAISQVTRFSCKQLFVLNLSLAIGIECVQLGIPSRSADMDDLFAAMLGTLAALLVVLVYRSIRTNGDNRSTR